MSHAKPKDEAQAALWKKLAANELAAPDTWEVQRSAGADKKETFERLIREKKLGYFALIRNLRNMEQAGVDAELVREAILARKGGADKLLPFRYIAAARHAKQFEPQLDIAMLAALVELPKLSGTTIVLGGQLRLDVRTSVAQVRHDARGRGSGCRDWLVACARRCGIRLQRQLCRGSASHGHGTAGCDPHGYSHGQHAARCRGQKVSDLSHDRLIVVTDVSRSDRVPEPKGHRLHDQRRVQPQRRGLRQVAACRRLVGCGRASSPSMGARTT